MGGGWKLDLIQDGFWLQSGASCATAPSQATPTAPSVEEGIAAREGRRALYPCADHFF